MDFLLKYINATMGGWVVAGFLFFACSAGYLYYSNKLADTEELNHALSQTAEQNLKTIRTLQKASEAADRVLLEREAEIEQLKQQSAKTITEIKEIYVNDTKAKNWADTEIPENILSRLRQNDMGGDGSDVIDGVRAN